MSGLASLLPQGSHPRIQCLRPQSVTCTLYHTSRQAPVQLLHILSWGDVKVQQLLALRLHSPPRSSTKTTLNISAVFLYPLCSIIHQTRQLTC